MDAPISRDVEELRAAVDRWKRKGLRVVTTNGCFDILHAGHLRTLLAAAEMGDRVVVGLNSDSSVRELKGDDRPVIPEATRAETLSALPFVDWVQVFGESRPDLVLRAARPDIHVKGGDYGAEALPEHHLISELGGRIEIVPEISKVHTSDLLAAYRAGRS